MHNFSGMYPAFLKGSPVSVLTEDGPFAGDVFAVQYYIINKLRDKT